MTSIGLLSIITQNLSHYQHMIIIHHCINIVTSLSLHIPNHLQWKTFVTAMSLLKFMGKLSWLCHLCNSYLID